MSFNFKDDNGVFGSNASVEINNGANAPAIVKMQLIECVTYFTATTGVNQVVWTAPSLPTGATNSLPFGTYSFAEVAIRYQTSSSSGTVMVEKTPSGTAVGSGTNLLAAALSTSATALNTTTYGYPSTSIALASNQLSNGDSLSLVFGGTQTSLTNLAVTVMIVRTL